MRAPARRLLSEDAKGWRGARSSDARAAQANSKAQADCGGARAEAIGEMPVASEERGDECCAFLFIAASGVRIVD